LVIFPFTKEFSNVTYHDFVVDYILNKIGTKKIIVGFNHHFGKNREGNFESLKKLAVKYNFSAEQKNPEIVDSFSISSSEIRSFLFKGKIKQASKFLGYNYFLSGNVVEGKKLGRSIGFPTANIEVENELKLIPKDGVYAVKVYVNKDVYGGMMNIGVKPTVEKSGSQSLEVHLFNFDKDIYNQVIKIEFIDRLRDEMKFENLEALKKQLSIDKKNAKSILDL
jgi:riboflavin kinase/FMN adenylyltransferase